MNEHLPIYSKVTVGELLQFLNAQCVKASKKEDYKTARTYAKKGGEIIKSLKEYNANNQRES